MVQAMIHELHLRAESLESFISKKLTTLYLGGGTPSLLEISELESLFSKVEQIWGISITDLSEVTLECNPEDISPEKAKAWKHLGINRLSIGLQSLNDEELKIMNRQHTAEQSKRCIQIAQTAGFQNISIDLIYGTPWKSNIEWEQELDWALQSGITHLSCYALTIEEKTRLHHQISTHILPHPNEESMVQQFEILQKKIQEFGWDDYEISNFCKPGNRAIHNGNYWKRFPYLGIGPSAHSFDGKNQRNWNVSNNAEYIRGINNHDIWYQTEILNENEIFNEIIMTGLRTKEGINRSIFSSLNTKERGNIEQKIIDFNHSNWIEEFESEIRLTHSGRLISDHIISELMII
jgi:oxygen-independent coproporphyrinogen-3 oxidase